ncbi:PTS sugar transporter subunit IIA [Oceanivirga miroungae]|nr:PTS glucose transporter subunit IIA [Oceanivirga miroungae]
MEVQVPNKGVFMGLFDFFNKKNKKEEDNNTLEVSVFAPIEGECVDISNVPDDTFAKKMLGEGVAIIPSKSGEVLSPVDGKIVQLFDTLHAFTIETKEGVDILVHFGMNTVFLKQEGFTKILNEGDEVKAGDAIVSYDLDLIIEKGYNPITAIVVLDSDEYSNVATFTNTKVDKTKEIIRIENK